MVSVQSDAHHLSKYENEQWLDPAQPRFDVRPLLGFISAMTRKISDIVAEASQLPYGERTELIEQLIADTAKDIDPKIEKAWTDTALRRLAEIESGKEKLIPGDQVAAEIRKIVGL